MAAASRMLAETGEVGELSLRSVAREVGVATTSIYLHFPNLEELILAVKTRYFAEFGEVMAAAAARASDSPVARLRASAHQYVRYGLENRGRYLAMFSSESLPPHLLPAVGYIGVDVFKGVRDEVAAAIGPERDADMLAIHLWTALHGIVTLRTLRPTFPWPELDRQIDSLIDWLLPVR